MRTYEKIVVAIFIGSIALQLSYFEEASIFLILSNVLLTLFYAFREYKLFRSHRKPNIVVAVIAGFVFAISLSTFFCRILLIQRGFIPYLPLTNIVFFVVLIVYVLSKRNDKKVAENYKGILVRSLVISIFTAFFFFIPIEFAPYTSVVYYLNNSRPTLQKNLKVVSYYEKSMENIAAGNCGEAIENAILAEQFGREWLGVPDFNIILSNGDVDTVFLMQYDLRNISLIYNRLYYAYSCRAEEYLGKGMFGEALADFRMGHQFLRVYNEQGGAWKEEEAVSLAQMGEVLSKLARFDEADFCFNEAIENDVIDKLSDSETSLVYSQVAASLKNRGFYEEASEYYQLGIEALLTDSLKSENRSELARLYAQLGHSKTLNKEIDKSLRDLDRSFFYIDSETDDNYRVGLIYYAVAEIESGKYRKADSLLRESLALYQNAEGGVLISKVSCLSLLSTVKRLLGDYKESERYIESGLRVMEELSGKQNTTYLNLLSSYAELNVLLSNYYEAQEQHEEILKIGEQLNSLQAADRANHLLSIATLKTYLSEFESAKKYRNQAVELLRNSIDIDSMIPIKVFNTELAYLNYVFGENEEAKQFYQHTINEDRDSLKIAEALNGLGLVYIDEQNYKLADSLFIRSLNMYENRFDYPYHSLVTLYINLGKLNTFKGDHQKATKYLSKASKMGNKPFDQGHVSRANIATAYGNLFMLQGKESLAKSYYQKALGIYKKKFRADHPKIIELEKIMGKIDSKTKKDQ